MRITVNTLSVSDDNEGIRTMMTGLVPALIRADPTSRFRLICSSANLNLFLPLPNRVEVRLIGGSRRRPLERIVHDQISVPWLVRHDTDVLLTPSTVGSLLAPTHQVVVVVAHLALPSVRKLAGGAALSAPHRAYYGPIMRLSHRRADAVVTISRFLGERLIADTSLSAAKVWAFPLGIDPPAAPVAVADADHRYILFVSTLWPYKNAQTLVRAMALTHGRLAGRLTAVIVGRDPDGRQLPALRDLARQLGVDEAVTFPGRVSGDELERLYGGATAMVLPSRAEGFGLAVLEAMARGVPVIVSNATSLPEVVDGAGILVDPDRPDSLADAIVGIVNDPVRRAELVSAGLMRASQLSWDRTARAYLNLFGRLVA